MSLDKSIIHNKERRKPYKKAKAVDSMCRNHGGCFYCEENRTYKNKEKERLAREELRYEIERIEE